MNTLEPQRPGAIPLVQPPVSKPLTDGDDRSTSIRRFFTGTGFPLFLLTAAAVYEAFLLMVVFAPESTGAWGGFAREFKQWCFQYDPRTGGMEWAAVWVMLIEPAFVALIAAFLWRRALRPLRSVAGWKRHGRSALGGALAAGVAMGILYAYGRPGDADTLLPFPGERIRTQLTPPPFDFVDQKGLPFSLEELRGRVVLATGIYAMCSTTCPEILLETKALLATLPAEIRSRISVVALSLNPEEDTMDLMDRVTEGYGFTYPEFRYVNGAPLGMHETLTRLGFAPVRNPQTRVIDHANLFLLLDVNGKIAYRFTLDVRHRSWLREALISLVREVEGT
jgi:protein SCO1